MIVLRACKMKRVPVKSEPASFHTSPWSRTPERDASLRPGDRGYREVVSVHSSASGLPISEHGVPALRKRMRSSTTPVYEDDDDQFADDTAAETDESQEESDASYEEYIALQRERVRLRGRDQSSSSSPEARGHVYSNTIRNSDLLRSLSNENPPRRVDVPERREDVEILYHRLSELCEYQVSNVPSALAAIDRVFGDYTVVVRLLCSDRHIPFPPPSLRALTHPNGPVKRRGGQVGNKNAAKRK